MYGMPAMGGMGGMGDMHYYYGGMDDPTHLEMQHVHNQHVKSISALNMMQDAFIMNTLKRMHDQA